MSYCERCKVHVQSPDELCPLCGGFLRRQPGEKPKPLYPRVDYPKSVVERIHILWYTIMGVFCGLLLFDLLTGNSVWYLLASIGFMSVGAAAFYSLKSRENLGFSLLKMVLLLSVVATAVDYTMGFARWSVNYVIPFLVMAATLSVTLLLLIQPSWFREYFVYQLTLCVLCAMTLLLRVFRVATIYWPSVVATSFSILAVVSLFFFYGRRSLHEIQKRIHF